MPTAIIYIANAGYLVPAFVSASAGRRYTPADAADFFIFDVGEKTAEGAAIEKAAVASGVRYVHVGAAILQGLHPTFGRLMVDRFLPEEYSDFVYVDSDTQVTGSLEPYARIPVPAGKIVASRDPMTLMLGVGEGTTREYKAYMAGLGLSEANMHTYFNAGILKTSREAWNQIAAEALRLVKEGGREYRYRDQDVLNIVCKGACELISIRWNYPGFLLGLGSVVETLSPRLVHYMSNPRPWHGPFPPWGQAGWRPYQELARSNPELAPYWPKLKPLRYLKYIAQQRYKAIFEAPSWASPRLRDYIIKSEALLPI